MLSPSPAQVNNCRHRICLVGIIPNCGITNFFPSCYDNAVGNSTGGKYGEQGNRRALSRGVKQISAARSIRWFGWGFVEPLIPVFLLSFSGSFAETGALRSVYDVVFLLVLVPVTLLADRIPSRTVLLLALALYPFIGLSYILAGATGAAVFVVIARAINGGAFCLDAVGTDTYLRRHAIRDRLASSFGFIDALSNSAWIFGALLSIPLVAYIPIHKLFFAVSVTSVLAFAFVIPLGTDKASSVRRAGTSVLRHGFLHRLRAQGITWSPDLKRYAMLTAFAEIIYVLGSFFIPLFAYTQGASLVEVILISAILAIPWTFAYHLGKLSDRVGNRTMLQLSLLCLAGTFILFTYSSAPPAYLVFAFVLGIIEVVIEISTKALITTATLPAHYGRVSGFMEGIGGFASLSGPIAIGFFVDSVGINVLFAALAFVALAICLALDNTLRGPDESALPEPGDSSEAVPNVLSV